MKIIQCSASSISRYLHCQFSYFLHYILGKETKAGKAALQGSIVHQTLEWMGKLRKRGKVNIDPMWLLNRAWDELTIKSPEIEIRRTTTRINKWTGELKEAADFKKCRIALETVLADPFYNPYKLTVLDAEQWFALEMPDTEWQCLDENGELCQFTARGFIDLINEIDENTIEICDWKTGSRKDFYTQESVDEMSLTQNIQARLYHLAAYFLYPKYKNILTTFYYTNDGGPITVAFSENDLETTIAILYKFFITVKQDILIHRNRSWRCKMCSFNKDDVCNRIWSDFCRKGVNYVKNRYGKLMDKEQSVIGKSKK